MLWNIIFDFFVKYIFGGYSSDGNLYNGFIGITFNGDDVGTSGLYTKLNIFDSYAEQETTYLMLGNYLSLIASIITIIAILLFCVFIIKKIIGIIFRLFTGSSAF